jgi:hypothetical protein
MWNLSVMQEVMVAMWVGLEQATAAIVQILQRQMG